MLNIDPIVHIDVNVGTTLASAGVFDVGAIIGSTAVVGKFDSSNRYKAYASLAEMAADGFQTTSDEYKAAAKYFGVDPAPKSLVMIFCNAASGSEETPVEAIVDAINKGAEFYAVYWIPASGVSQYETKLRAIAAAFEEMNKGVVFYGVTGEVDTVTGASALMATLKGDDTKRAVALYCTSSEDDAAGLMGAAMGLSRVHQDDVFSLCYKSVASATINNITEADVNKIKAVNGNVYVQRTKGRSFVENGATASGMRFDDVLYVDRMTFEIQTAIYELIADSSAKLPQNDSTSALFLNAIHGVLENYYNMGALDTAPWRGAAIEDKITTGEYVEHGHAEFVDSFTLQSDADRLLHKAMPITVLLCLSGSVESIEITVDVQT